MGIVAVNIEAAIRTRDEFGLGNCCSVFDKRSYRMLVLIDNSLLSYYQINK